ncbi:winged helix-turn-helix domain-containing protein [Candidatus Venteria ishoeyi]|uniref:MarR family protein n=1 Tax=Candidatus Venteria ishoeyi TaxID=1899563 RepID=A0A1H6FCE6_9GAMM|nr:helix-turn-helix domain-containing protein [Candidatus Venteria ishoeyi]SEH07071.1 MarR family protein [Candidatus Venteria ishoeyi]
MPTEKVVTFEPDAFDLLMSGKRLALLRYVRDTGTATLESLSEATGLARTTVSRNINLLAKLGLIQFSTSSAYGRHKVIEPVYSKQQRLIVQTEI